MPEQTPAGRNEDAVRRFIERFALVLSQAGFPRMPARVFVALLAADDGKRTAAELGEVLQVSPAAISGAVRYLQQVRLAAKEREPGTRRDHYRVYDEIWYEAVVNEQQMFAESEAALLEGVAALGDDTPAGRRLEETRQFFDFLKDELATVFDRWRMLRAQRAEATITRH
jgi:DNA-binding transcriptional regulator GbsR (MarR family)